MSLSNEFKVHTTYSAIVGFEHVADFGWNWFCKGAG